jgi:hypothetical protein
MTAPERERPELRLVCQSICRASENFRFPRHLAYDDACEKSGRGGGGTPPSALAL